MQLSTGLVAAFATLAALSGSTSATNFTGDVLNGVPVISYLDLADVPAQTVSRYYLRVGELNGGSPLHVPVWVARGTPESLNTGKRLSLSAAIHGDELNGVRVMQKMLDQLKGQVATLNGTGKCGGSSQLLDKLSVILYWQAKAPAGRVLRHNHLRLSCITLLHLGATDYLLFSCNMQRVNLTSKQSSAYPPSTQWASI